MTLGIRLPRYGRPIGVPRYIALEVSYSTYPAIHETMDIIVGGLRPQVA